MKFYICGKIGEDRPSPETLAKFKKAEDMLKSRGHQVFNPTTSGLGHHAESLAQAADYDTSFYQEILLLDLVQLSQCDAVLVLPDWHNSDGSKVELMLARALGHPIYEEAPNGRLFKVRMDARKVVDYSDPKEAITVGEVMKVLQLYKPETPLGLSADFLLGEPFTESFDKQIEGVIYEVRDSYDPKSETGMKVVFDGYMSCTLNFD